MNASGQGIGRLNRFYPFALKQTSFAATTCGALLAMGLFGSAWAASFTGVFQMGMTAKAGDPTVSIRFQSDRPLSVAIEQPTDNQIRLTLQNARLIDALADAESLGLMLRSAQVEKVSMVPGENPVLVLQGPQLGRKKVLLEGASAISASETGPVQFTMLTEPGASHATRPDDDAPSHPAPAEAIQRLFNQPDRGSRKLTLSPPGTAQSSNLKTVVSSPGEVDTPKRFYEPYALDEADLPAGAAAGLSPSQPGRGNGLSVEIVGAKGSEERVIQGEKMASAFGIPAPSQNPLAEAARYYQAGDYQRAYRLLSEVVRKHPGDPDAVAALAGLAVKLDNPTQAKDLYATAARLEPTKYRYTYAVHLASMKAHEEAIRELRALVQLQPNEPAYLYALGTELQQMGDAQVASFYLARAVELKPSSADVHYNLGLALEALGKKRDARKQYESVLLLDPTARDARDALKRLN